MEFLSDEEYLANVFPKTPEEFDRVEVISTSFVRIDLVRWMNEIVKKEVHIIESSDGRGRFSFFAKTMDSSFSKTNDLYKIQAAKNLDEGVHIHISPDNIYYNILFKSHKLWTTITNEFVGIFYKFNVYENPQFVFQIPTKPLSERAILIIRAIVSNKKLMEVMPQLQENSEIMLGYIKIWHDSRLPSIKS